VYPFALRPLIHVLATSDLQEQIRLRAYALYEQRRSEGHELEDWLQAESEVTQQKAKGVGA
jgi:hypothetical protein